MKKLKRIDFICRDTGTCLSSHAFNVRCVRVLTIRAMAVLLSVVPVHMGLADEASVGLDQVVEQSVGPSGSHERVILKFKVAEEIAKTFYMCAERKGDARSIHIVDQYGQTVYAGRMDGQIADNIDVARMKARSALYFRESTEPWLQRSRDDRLMALSISQIDQFVAPVGLPIIVDHQLLGAVGIGGASGDCARQALAVVLGVQPSLEHPG